MSGFVTINASFGAQAIVVPMEKLQLAVGIIIVTGHKTEGEKLAEMVVLITEGYNKGQFRGSVLGLADSPRTQKTASGPFPKETGPLEPQDGLSPLQEPSAWELRTGFPCTEHEAKLVCMWETKTKRQ